MNITFFIIHLREPSANCKHDKLVVGENGEMYTYCRFHSNFNLYPKFDKFSVKTLKLLRPFEMNSTFSITDKDLIFNTVNFPQNVSNSDSIYKPQCYKVGGKFYVTSFLIRVPHTLKVRVDIISKIQNEYVIYDGPGNIFDTMSIHGTKSYYIASAFQCFIQMLITSFIQNHEHYFEFYSVVNHKRIHQKIKPGFTNVLLIPIDSCQENLCYITLETSKHFHLNFTVLSMSVQSSVYLTCLFRGLHISELFGTHQRKISEFCYTLNSPSHLSMRSFYTSGNMLYLIMYWYKGYSTISAVLSVSVTKCQAIQVDACSFTENCIFLTVKWNPYLKGITKNTNMTLTMQHHSKAVKFSLPEKNCVVLMVASWEDHLTHIDLQFMFKARCQLTLLSEPGTIAIGPISA